MSTFRTIGVFFYAMQSSTVLYCRGMRNASYRTSRPSGVMKYRFKRWT